MIGPGHEQVQTGEGDRFFDSVSIDFCDGEQDVCGIVRVTRFPGSSSARGHVLVLVRGEPAQLDGNDIALEVVSPLERWHAAVTRAGASLQLDAAASSPPVAFLSEDASTASLTGVESYEQLCELSGTVGTGSSSFPVSCIGRRVHSWGELDWDRIAMTRSVYGVSEERRAIVFESARPAGSGGHGDERRLARLIAAPDEIEAFEDARLSTVYGEEGLPAKAGLELFAAGEEFPRRVGGEALHSIWLDGDVGRSAVGFFRWSMDGTPAFGLYEAVVPR
jgi:hypothetical protein